MQRLFGALVFLLASALGPAVLAAEPVAPLTISPSAQALTTTALAAAAADDYEFAAIQVRAAKPIGLARSKATAEEIDRLNSVNTEDSIKYLPSVSVRKRYIGDLNGIVQLRGVSNFQTTRILVKADDYLLLSYYLQTRYNGAPRWSLVSPQELLSAEINYGPYQAFDSGNAMGGTINLVTKQPTHRSFELDSTAFVQDYSLYGNNSSPEGRRVHVGYADRFGDLSLYTFYDHQKSSSQPMQFYNSAPGTAGGATATGAFRDKDPLNVDRITYGDQGADQVETNLFKLKLGYDFGPALKVQAQVGQLERLLYSLDKKSYLRDGAGNTIWGDGNAATKDATFGGAGFDVNPANFGLSKSDRSDILGGLGFKGQLAEDWDYSLSSSFYSLQHDQTKTSNRNPADPLYDGSGTLSDYEDSGWRTADLKVGEQGVGLKALSAYAGGHYEAYSLRANNYNSANWDAGDKTTWLQSTGGSTQTLAAFGQAEWAFAPGTAVTAGLRYERWLAFGSYYNKTSTALSNPNREDERLSPKATFKVASGDWNLAVGVAKAYRNPIIEELYQNAFTTTSVNISNKDLRSEDGTQMSATLSNSGAWGAVQLTLFRDDIKDAILYQSDTSVVPSVTTYVNVDRALTNGIELALSRRALFGLWDIQANSMLQDPRVLEDRANRSYEGKQLPLTTPFRVTVINTLHLSDALDASLASRYFTKQYARLDNLDVNGDTFGGQSSGLVFDLKFNERLAPQVTLGLGVDNLFSAQVYDYHPYPQRTYFTSLSGEF